MKKKVYYHDTDSGGVVYYANYLKYFEEARTEFLAHRGADVKSLAEAGTLFVVRHVDINYKAPARYGDLLEIATAITKVKNVSLEFTQEVRRDESVLVVAKTTLVCIDTSFSPAPLPSHIAASLKT